MFTTYDLGDLVKIVAGKYKGKCGRVVDFEDEQMLWVDCCNEQVNCSEVELICEVDYENETFRPSRRKERFFD